MNNRTLGDNYEINILDLLFDMICMWRPLVALMLVCGFLVTSAMYVRTDMRAKEALLQLEEDNKLEITPELMELDLNQLRRELTNTEKANVEKAVEQYTYVKNRREYLDKAPYYNMDKDTMVTLTAHVFFINPQERAGFNAEMARVSIQDEIEKYLMEQYDIQSQYGQYLIESDWMSRFRDEDDNVQGMDISFSVLFDKTIAETDLKARIESAADSNLRNVNHSIVFQTGDENSQTAMYDRYIANRDILSIEIEYNKSIDNFSDEQRRYFELLTKKALGEGNPKNVDEEEVEEEDELDIVEIPTFSKRDAIKYFVVGAMLGAFMLALIVFVRLALLMKINDAGQICSVYGIRDYGQIRRYPYKSAFARFCYSKMVYEFRYKENIEDVLEEIKSYIKISNKDKEPTLFTIGHMPEDIAALGGQMVDISNGPRSKRTKLIKDYEDIILVLESKKVGARQVDELMACFKELNKKPSGIIIAEG